MAFGICHRSNSLPTAKAWGGPAGTPSEGRSEQSKQEAIPAGTLGGEPLGPLRKRWAIPMREARTGGYELVGGVTFRRLKLGQLGGGVIGEKVSKIPLGAAGSISRLPEDS